MDTADQMPEGVAAKGVATQQVDVDAEDDRADADTEGLGAIGPGPDECMYCIVGEHHDEQDGEVKEVAVDVLEHEGERLFAKIGTAPFTDGTGRWIAPEGLVVGATIVVAGEAEEGGERQDDEGRREGQPARPPRRLGAEPGVGGIAPEFWRIERREVGTVGVVGVLKRCPGGVDDE